MNTSGQTDSFDPRMKEYPLFISFSRTGAHWINCVMELYFDRPRLREGRETFLDKTRTDWAWFHDHDIYRTITYDRIGHHNVLYLYRNPVDTIFSNIMYQKYAGRSDRLSKLFKYFLSNLTNIYGRAIINKEEVKLWTALYLLHMKKWLVSDHKANVFVTYENLKNNPTQEFAKICDFFGEKCDSHRMTDCFNRVSSEAIVSKKISKLDPGMNRKMLSSQYTVMREKFYADWGEYVLGMARQEGLLIYLHGNNC